MFVAVCEPDFNNPALMLATYECSVCGLQERAQIDAALQALNDGQPNLRP